MLLPSLSKARTAAQRVNCLSNMRQVLVATSNYAARFGDFPFNWEPGIAHRPRLSYNYTEIYNILGPPSQPASDPELWNEGHALVSWWAYYLLEYKFLGDARVTGCSVGASSGWESWPASYYNPSYPQMPANLRDPVFLREHPTYVYRGASDVDDLRMNLYNCGQIAWANPSDPKFGGRSGTYFPHANSKGTSPLFHCPVFVNTPAGFIDGYENYMPTHGDVRTKRNRSIAPMSGGSGRDGHFLSQVVGWTDGHAGFYQQSRVTGVYYVNYRGDVTTDPLCRY